MTFDRSKVDKFVGMLGSEHDGERANAARFLHKFAQESKLSMPEFFAKVYGGSAERIVYRDRPAGAARGHSAGSKSFEEQWAERQAEIRRQQDAARERQREANRKKQQDEAKEKADRGPAPKSKAYGMSSIQGKIATVLAYHSEKLTTNEKDFLAEVRITLDNGNEMSPKMRARYMQIMTKAGYA